MTAETQTVGSQYSSDSETPNGAIYTTKCPECGTGNPDTVQDIISEV